MSGFPRTKIGELSVSRMIIGSNWFLGFSHTSAAKDALIKSMGTPERIADILEVYLRAGVDTTMGLIPRPNFREGIARAQDRVGRELIVISTPILEVSGTAEAREKNLRMLDEEAALGAKICMPHQATTDALLDRKTKTIPGMAEICQMIRERGMIPGLSTHMPETPAYADRTNLDVETYIQIYNAAGFLMQIEADWVHRLIWASKKPVITIKPLAAGRLLPLVGLAFAWSTIRPIDMVTVGAMTPDEAAECVEISLAVLERRDTTHELQWTRSKASVRDKK